MERQNIPKSLMILSSVFLSRWKMNLSWRKMTRQLVVSWISRLKKVRRELSKLNGSKKHVSPKIPQHLLILRSKKERFTTTTLASVRTSRLTTLWDSG